MNKCGTREADPEEVACGWGVELGVRFGNGSVMEVVRSVKCSRDWSWFFFLYYIYFLGCISSLGLLCFVHACVHVCVYVKHMFVYVFICAQMHGCVD